MKKKKIDRQITGMSGEYFVAAELLKRNYQVAMTIGNAKAIDLYATDEETERDRWPARDRQPHWLR